MSLVRETYQLFGGVDDEPLSVVAVRITNEEASSLTIRHEGRLLEHPEDFQDDNDNDNYSNYVENVSVHAGAHIKSGVRLPAFI
jgi:hypothetical protein